MSSIAEFDGELDSRLREGLDDAYDGGNRIQSVLTSTVPGRFPGRFVVWVAERAPTAVESSALLNAAVAVEYANLHQYLHAIPAADGELISPADTSPYVEEPRTAILDGDYLQSRAFARIADIGEDAKTRLACYALLARGSIDRYRNAHDERPSEAFAAFLGRVGHVGAIIGGSDRDTRERVERAAAELGQSVPMTTPTRRERWTDEVTAEVQSGLRRLEELLPNDPPNPRLRSPIEDRE